MGASGCSIFLFMGGALGLRLLQAARLPLDGVTFALGVYNFSVTGVLAAFFLPLPMRLKQGAMRVRAAAERAACVC